MARKEQSALVEALRAVPDPRRQCKNLRHLLIDVLAMHFCAVVCGCDDFVEVEQFARAKGAFFRRFLTLPNGIPSHDTFRRVLQAVCPKALQTCLIGWLTALRQRQGSSQPVVAVDGKAMRGTADAANGTGPLHLVSAWATANGLTLGQVAADAKSNEITAIPELLELLELEGCVVTIDAAGCQKAIAAQIIDKGADYVLALKGNQKTLHRAVVEYFVQQTGAAQPDRGVRRYRVAEQGHGRSESREVWVAPVPEALTGAKAWTALATIVLVIRESTDWATGKVTDEVRYFISSLPARVKRLADVVRQHWQIENNLHWVLDVAFGEDRRRLRDRTAAINQALLNRLALSLLRQDKTVKAGVKCKRKTAGWNEDYLLHVLRNAS